MVRLKRDWRSAPGLDEQDRAMLEFAEKITFEAAAIQEGDVQRLRAVGFSDEQILEITLLASYRNFINRIAEALGVEPDDEYKQGEAFTHALLERP